MLTLCLYVALVQQFCVGSIESVSYSPGNVSITVKGARYYLRRQGNNVLNLADKTFYLEIQPNTIFRDSFE